ncbi:YlaF family protein [Metabacillus fastidiosus]|uniref:YlaF family protein n=1 Tax=Metabacillus fastidiosus TaxID=1458 RepID=UPI002E1A651B|nr:YlaF family protein [Metabacillus fastidiosus]
MKLNKWIFLLLAFLAAMCMTLIGVAIGIRSTLGAAGAIFVLIIIMGTGFTLKKKMSDTL